MGGAVCMTYLTAVITGVAGLAGKFIAESVMAVSILLILILMIVMVLYAAHGKR